MSDLRGREGTAARALEFAILTAGRTSEVLGARWSESDLTARVWTLPGERMKAGKAAREIGTALLRFQATVWVRERVLQVCPERHKGRLGELLWNCTSVTMCLHSQQYVTHYLHKKLLFLSHIQNHYSLSKRKGIK